MSCSDDDGEGVAHMAGRRVPTDGPGFLSGKARKRTTRQPPIALAGPLRFPPTPPSPPAKPPRADSGSGGGVSKQQVLDYWMEQYGPLSQSQKDKFLSIAFLNEIITYPIRRVFAAIRANKKLGDAAEWLRKGKR